MQTVTSSRQGLAIAWRAAKAYSVDGTQSWPLRIWRWPGYFLTMALVTAGTAGDTVWKDTASINVPCRSQRPQRVLPGLLGFVVLLAILLVLMCLWLSSLTWRALGRHTVSTLAAVLIGVTWFVLLIAPVAAAQLRPTWLQEHCALRRWRHRLQRRGRVVVVAVSAAAWPMRERAFSALLPEVIAESRQAGQIVLMHARSPSIAAIYRRRGARPHPQFPTVLAWF